MPSNLLYHILLILSLWLNFEPSKKVFDYQNLNLMDRHTNDLQKWYKDVHLVRLNPEIRLFQLWALYNLVVG